MVRQLRADENYLSIDLLILRYREDSGASSQIMAANFSFPVIERR